MDDPTAEQLDDLGRRAVDVRDRWIHQARRRSHGDPDVPPVVIEFAGSPKAGKSSTIEIVEHFFRRAGFRVFAQIEGASRRTPASLKGDLVAFNVWSLNYAVSELLLAANSVERPNIILLDRGPFDAIAWMRLLEGPDGLSSLDRQAVEAYALLDKWIRLIDRAFLFTCEPAVSLEREVEQKLTAKPGRAMNGDFLDALLAEYRQVQRELEARYPIEAFDTTRGTSSKGLAFKVADRILQIADQRLNADMTSVALQETTLVIPRGSVDGWMRESALWTGEEDIGQIRRVIDQEGEVVERVGAESNPELVQLISYSLIHSGDSYLCLRRAETEKRVELRGRYSILFGGHVDMRDTDAGSDVLLAGLRRELLEELQLALLETDIRFVGFATDTTTEVGRQHLGAIFDVVIGQKELAVSAAADLADYFDEDTSRRLMLRPVGWIRQRVDKLDPWSLSVFASIVG